MNATIAKMTALTAELNSNLRPSTVSPELLAALEDDPLNEADVLARYDAKRLDPKHTHWTGDSAAEMLAKGYGDDGQNWDNDGDGDLEADCESQAERHHRNGDAMRYEFADGSAIVTTPGGWDVGYSGVGLDCTCWPSAGIHMHECPAEQSHGITGREPTTEDRREMLTWQLGEMAPNDDLEIQYHPSVYVVRQPAELNRPIGEEDETEVVAGGWLLWLGTAVRAKRFGSAEELANAILETEAGR